MREHMYCEITGQKTENQGPVPISFFSPSLTISGKKAYAQQQTHLNVLLHWDLEPGTQVAFCVYRFPYAGDVDVPRPESDESYHQ